jgi:Ser/Thr protein kinase RdoA (MazF antagonist)
VPQIPPAPAWQALAELFGLGRVDVPPAYVTRGAMGEVWRLETAAGRWAVKWQFPWVSTEPRPADLAVQRAAAAAGIPLPRPVTTPDDAAVVPVDGRPARVYEWADLGPPLTVPVPPAVAAEAGRLLGLLHGLRLPPVGPPDPWYTEIQPDSYWPGLIARATAAGAPWAGRLAAAAGLIAGLGARLVAPAGQPLLTCHRDFNPDNVLPAAADGRLLVLDWENSGPLSPVRELGYAVCTWCAGGGRFDPAAADALLASYTSAAGSAPALGPDLFGTAIATHLNVLHVMAEQWLAESDHRGYTEAFIAGLLDRDLGDVAAAAGPGAAAWPGTGPAAGLAQRLAH